MSKKILFITTLLFGQIQCLNFILKVLQLYTVIMTTIILIRVKLIQQKLENPKYYLHHLVTLFILMKISKKINLPTTKVNSQESVVEVARGSLRTKRLLKSFSNNKFHRIRVKKIRL
jgi:hypothetical protein